MFKLFKNEGAGDAFWPTAAVVAAIKARFGSAELLGQDGPLVVYGVEDNGVNFIVALVETAPGSGALSELGFLARFVGFSASASQLERLNRNLHISVASFEQSDIFLLAGLEVTGAFDERQFNGIIDAWRRDLMLAIHHLTEESASLASSFPAARLEAARNFAVNRAPQKGEEGGKNDVDMLSAFLGVGKPKMAPCGECDGRGKRGLIARRCVVCEGSGLVQ